MSVNPETINSHMTQRSAGGKLRLEVHARIEKIIEGVIQARAPRAYGFRVLARALDPFLQRPWTALAHIGVVSRPSWKNPVAEMFRILSCTIFLQVPTKHPRVYLSNLSVCGVRGVRFEVCAVNDLYSFRFLFHHSLHRTPVHTLTPI